MARAIDEKQQVRVHDLTFIRTWSVVFGGLALLTVLSIALLLLADVTGRFVFDAPIRGTAEYGWILGYLAFAFALPAICVLGDLGGVASRDRPSGRRSLVHIVAVSLIQLIVFLALAVFSIDGSLDAFEAKEQTDVVGLPSGLRLLFVSIGFAFAACATLLNVVGLVRARSGLSA